MHTQPVKQDLLFLRKLTEDGCNIRMDKGTKRLLEIRDSVDKAMMEDIQEAEKGKNLDDEINSSDDDLTKFKK